MCVEEEDEEGGGDGRGSVKKNRQSRERTRENVTPENGSHERMRRSVRETTHT